LHIVSRTARFVRGALLSFGPRWFKKYIWNKEFGEGKWNFIDNTAEDCVYPPLEKYACKGSILDLGCGPGNTANELSLTSYSTYLGVDISEAALSKATDRTVMSGRSEKNRFAIGDFLAYEPEGSFDVILFRESMYHVPIGKIKPLLYKYSGHLSNRGVFMVRLGLVDQKGDTARRPARMIGLIESAFNVVEKQQDKRTGAVVIVFQPKETHLGPNGSDE